MKQLFLLFFLCGFSNMLSAQTDYFPIERYQIKPLKVHTLPLINLSSNAAFSSVSIMKQHNSLNVSAYNYDDLAIFCKLEVKMEKAAGIPVKFRLGEVNYVERLEGKPYSIFY